MPTMPTSFADFNLGQIRKPTTEQHRHAQLTLADQAAARGLGPAEAADAIAMLGPAPEETP